LFFFPPFVCTLVTSRDQLDEVPPADEESRPPLAPTVGLSDKIVRPRYIKMCDVLSFLPVMYLTHPLPALLPPKARSASRDYSRTAPRSSFLSYLSYKRKAHFPAQETRPAQLFPTTHPNWIPTVLINETKQVVLASSCKLALPPAPLSCTATTFCGGFCSQHSPKTRSDTVRFPTMKKHR